MQAEARFPAMGSTVHLVVVGPSMGLLMRGRELIEALERRWSRFLPTSEVSRLNRSAGRAVRVSEQTLALVEHALEGARITGGRYDATVLGAILRAGYDRTFELLTETPRNGTSPLGTGSERIVVDRERSTVTLPPGVGFDPGGIGKGCAADLVVHELLGAGATGVCANIGGDVRVAGASPEGTSWSIAVEHPRGDDPVAVVGLRDGAVATSARTRRVWGPRSDRRHHLIDPGTGRPARSRVLSATVVAALAWQAEVLAKATFILGMPGAFALLESTGTDGLIVTEDGVVHRSPRFDRLTVRREAAAVGSDRE